MLNWYFYNTFIRRCQPRLWNFEKHKNVHFSKSKKHKIQDTSRWMCGIHRKYEYCGTCIRLHKQLPRRTTCNYCIHIVYNSTSNAFVMFFGCFQHQKRTIMKYLCKLKNWCKYCFLSFHKYFRENSWKMTNRQYSHHWYQQHANIV